MLVGVRTASSYTVGPQAYQVTFVPAASSGTNGFLVRVRLLYMDSLGSPSFTDATGSGGGVHSGIAAAMGAAERWNESLAADERNRLVNGGAMGRAKHAGRSNTINWAWKRKKELTCLVNDAIKCKGV